MDLIGKEKGETGFLDLKMQQLSSAIYITTNEASVDTFLWQDNFLWPKNAAVPFTSPPMRLALNVEPCYMWQPFRGIAPLLLNISILQMQEPKIHLQYVNLVLIWCSSGVHLVLSPKSLSSKTVLMQER